MNLKPLGKRLVIKKVKVESKTSTGIVLPDGAKEAPNMAEVIALSEKLESKLEDKDIALNIGDKVIFSEYAGTKVEVDGEDQIIIGIEDILAIVE